jgi:two-component system, sensor histidine kinase and response regulator
VYCVLIVDDSKTNQLYHRSLLSHLGMSAVVVNDGAEALEAFAHGQFDAILMDVQMPGTDGYETTATMREQETSRGMAATPIIGVSGRAIRGDREAAIAVGMNDYLVKPVNIDELRVVLERWLPNGIESDHEVA